MFENLLLASQKKKTTHFYGMTLAVVGYLVTASLHGSWVPMSLPR
jgi:hypothetical protein